MVSLTLRSGRDGRFLARIVDRGGFAFVLDFGDRRVIDDVSQRLLKGFTMWRMGPLVTAVPQQSEMLQLLAEFYAREGLLVAFEEPNWPRDEGAEVSAEDDLEPPPPTATRTFGQLDIAKGSALRHDPKRRSSNTGCGHTEKEGLPIRRAAPKKQTKINI